MGIYAGQLRQVVQFYSAPLAQLPAALDTGPGIADKSGVSGLFEEVARGPPRSVHLCLVSDPGGWLIAPLLSETAPAWKAWEGRSGSSDAEVVAAAERRGPEEYTLGAGNSMKQSTVYPWEILDT